MSIKKMKFWKKDSLLTFYDKCLFFGLIGIIIFFIPILQIFSILGLIALGAFYIGMLYHSFKRRYFGWLIFMIIIPLLSLLFYYIEMRKVFEKEIKKFKK